MRLIHLGGRGNGFVEWINQAAGTTDDVVAEIRIDLRDLGGEAHAAGDGVQLN